MHTLLGLSSVLLVMLGGYLALGLLRRLADWSQRRDLQFLVLAAPIVALGLVVGALHHFADQVCFLGAPPWDYVLGMALPLGMGLVAVGGVGLGLLRLILMYRLLTRPGVVLAPELQGLAERLARRLGTPTPRVLLAAYNRPLALTCGLLRPTILLSTWMMDQLDPRELESVLAHELGHVARRDYPLIWLATLLRDSFFYLPSSWAAYRQLQQEKELACDDLAIGVTRRPLALASALAKVWQQAFQGPTFEAVPSLVGPSKLIEGRIERLMATPRLGDQEPRSRLVALGIGAAALTGLLVVEIANASVMLAPMGCGLPFSLGM